MVKACRMAQDCGIHMSVMVLLGLAGRDGSGSHSHATAEALNAMQPRLLSFLRVVPVPGSDFEKQIASGGMEQLSEQGVVAELRTVISGLELSRTVLRANHSSNVVPIEARLPRDRDKLLSQLEGLLSSGSLDHEGPGSMPLWL